MRGLCAGVQMGMWFKTNILIVGYLILPKLVIGSSHEYQKNKTIPVCLCVCLSVAGILFFQLQLSLPSIYTKMSGEESGFVRVVTGCTLSMTMLFHGILVFSTFVTTIMHLICICTVIMFLKMLMEAKSQIKLLEN